MTDTLRPGVSMFTEKQVEGVLRDAFRALDEVGFFVENEEALALLHGAGLRIEKGRVFAGEAIVRRALATAPPRVTLYDRDGKEACRLGGVEIAFDPGSAAIHILDPETHRRRAPMLRDCANLARVTESCRHIAAQSTGLVPADVPEALSDRVRLYIALLNSAKPIVTGTFRKDAFAVMKAMLIAVRGTEQALRDKPLAIFDCCPTPPLKWSDLTCQALIDCARAGIPAEMVSMPLGGATAPVTLREMVVQHAAECLSGILIHQLAAPGAPIIYGGSPAAFDMRHGTTPMGAIETMMVDMAYAQTGRSLGLPTHAYMGLSDSKTVDWQAGMETGVGAVLAALAGINMISGAGMLDFESTQSLEKLVLDNEVCGMAQRLVRGIGRGSEGRAVELLGELVGRGEFLAHRHTRENFRSEILAPGRVIDRATWGDWETAGSADSYQTARAEVWRILEKGEVSSPKDSIRRELDALMNTEARRLGFGDLPETF